MPRRSKPTQPTVRSVDELVKAKQLEKVAPDAETAQVELEQAKTNLKTARKIVKENPVLAYTALYDAVRLSIQAHMRAHGLRPKPGGGGHMKTMSYAEAVLNAPPSPQADIDLEEVLDRMRLTRNRLEYEGGFIGEEQVQSDLEEALVIVELMEERFLADLSGSAEEGP